MNILTFDIEEWFHLLDNASTKTEKEWVNYETRIHKNMNHIYEILDENNYSATFFVVGWIAERYPEIIKEISERDYEIGSHTHSHQLAYEQDRKTFYNDVEKSIKTLEDCTGKKVTSFRSPGFSITERNKWAFEVLYELGITIDSSISTAKHAHGGLPSYNGAEPTLLRYNGITLKEFPVNTYETMGKSFIFSGGGYFRLLPYRIIKHCTKNTEYVMSYFHPRDFDFKQPVIQDLSRVRKFKSYVGLKSCKPKLKKWVNDFEFIDIRQANLEIDWEKAQTISLD